MARIAAEREQLANARFEVASIYALPFTDIADSNWREAVVEPRSPDALRQRQDRSSSPGHEFVGRMAKISVKAGRLLAICPRSD
jgi:hypothetical protein